MFPLSSTMELSQVANLGLAVLIGIGFGFFLEKAGFGSARKLVAVFYLYDMAVVKVMFTAIVTAMAGLFVLSAAGSLDLAELYVEPSNYTAAILGGLVFGAGFVIGGYCPGTSLTAAATGRLDGVAFLAGIFVASYAYAEFLPGFDAWLAATAQDDVTLPGLTGIPMGWFVLLFAGFLALAGWGMSVAERRFAGLKP
ncbi:MAG: YeeE/YedE family protein [Burkholderiales bacterium]|nr:YeeE/YedE family protein [Burkholderiales bacterium]MBZ0249065.1 YeeE/YedE family protein [Burkholderiales bacterium]